MININDIEFKQFPGGELHITSDWWDTYIKEITTGITEDDGTALCRIMCSDDFMKLALFTNAYKSMGFDLKELILPYIPYARQDRIPNKGEALSIKVFAQLLNSLGWKRVVVLDPHSDVSTALIENIQILPQWEIWGYQLIKLNAEDVIGSFDLISPDAGALKKIYNLQNYVKSSRCKNIRVGTKHRDTETGKITGTSVDGHPFNNTGIVVDDICDGGRTFVELAKVIRKDYEKLILCITHGIFSNGLDELFQYYDEIYTTNSWSGSKRFAFIDKKYKDRLHVVEIENM